MVRAGAVFALLVLAGIRPASAGVVAAGRLPLAGTAELTAYRTDTARMLPRFRWEFEKGSGAQAPARPGLGFEGLGSTGQFPASCDVAAGPTALVQAANGQVAFFSKEGAQTFSASAAAFFSGLAETAQPDQPRVCYDPAAARFYLLFSEHDDAAMVSNYLLAVSDDSDPAGGWFLYKVVSWRSEGAEQAWMERPGLGHNDGGLLLTGTYLLHQTGQPVGSGFFVLPKAPLLAGQALTVAKFIDLGRPWATATGCPGSDDFAFAGTVTGLNSVRVYGAKHPESQQIVKFVDQSSIASLAPPSTAASTDGGLFQTNGSTVIGPAWRDEVFYMASNIGTTAGPCAVRWRGYDTTNFDFNSMPHIMSGVVSQAGTNCFMPALAANVHSDVALVCTASSTSVTSDVLTAGRIRTDPPTFMSTPFSAASAGGSPYVDTRWGNYFGACVDPVDGEAFWGTASVVRSDGAWGTRVFSWYVSRTWPALPTGFSLFRGVLLSGSLTSLQADDGDYLVAQKGLVLNASEPPIQLVVDGTAASGQLLSVGLEVAAKVNTPGLSQRVQFFNWGTGQYDTLATSAATVAESLQTTTAPGAGTAYVQSGTGAVRARVQWLQGGPVASNAWSASIDLVRWKARTR